MLGNWQLNRPYNSESKADAAALWASRFPRRGNAQTEHSLTCSTECVANIICMPAHWKHTEFSCKVQRGPMSSWLRDPASCQNIVEELLVVISWICFCYSLHPQSTHISLKQTGHVYQLSWWWQQLSNNSWRASLLWRSPNSFLLSSNSSDVRCLISLCPPSLSGPLTGSPIFLHSEIVPPLKGRNVTQATFRLHVQCGPNQIFSCQSEQQKSHGICFFYQIMWS